MREGAFVKGNKDKWQKIDREAQNSPTADEIAENFIELTDDLSYAKTFYPGSQTEKYLNRLTGKYFFGIYKHREKEKGKFIRFWQEALPMAMYRQRRNMLYSLMFFVTGVLLGVFSAQQDGNYVRLILGDSYVNMTLENIEEGDPMAVYKSSESAPMFLYIASNNIKVAFIAFIFGIFFSVGTLVVLFLNGIMLGAFQYFFFQKGLLGVSMLSIWLHGTLEISAIVIAGGAGLALGNSFLFPKTYSRLHSLTHGARDAFKIVVGLIPVFIVAAFIESFWTRLTHLPTYFNATVIILSALFLIYYFVYYPYKVNLNKHNLNNPL